MKLANLLCAAVLVGCDTDSSPHTLVRDSAGVRLVVIRSGGDTVQLPPPSLVIGQHDGPTEYLFSEIAAVEVASDGVVFVADMPSAEIRSFSPDGQFLRRFGGKGRGPGELQGINRMWIVDQELVVEDLEGNRLTAFSRSGDVIRSRPLREAGTGWVIPMQFTDFGWVGEVRPLDADQWQMSGLRLWLIDPWEGKADRLLVDASSDGDLRHRAHTTRSELIVVQQGRPYRVTRVGLDGRVRQVVVRQMPDAKVQRGDVEEAKREASMILQARPTRPGWTNGRAEALNLIDQVQLGEDLQSVSRVLGSDAGDVWVEQTNYESATEYLLKLAMVPVATTKTSTYWDVLTPGGELRAIVEVPPNVTVKRAFGGVIWAVTRDRDDVQYVARYDLPRALMPGTVNW